MKRKTLVAMAVASTLGCAGAMAAGQLPMSVDDNSPWLSHLTRQSSMIQPGSPAFGSTSSQAGGSLGETVSGLNGDSLSGDQPQIAGTASDEGATLALADQGIYNDFYTVSLAPTTFDQWDYYIVSPASDASSSEDLYVVTPAFTVFMIPGFDS